MNLQSKNLVDKNSQDIKRKLGKKLRFSKFLEWNIWRMILGVRNLQWEIFVEWKVRNGRNLQLQILLWENFEGLKIRDAKICGNKIRGKENTRKTKFAMRYICRMKIHSTKHSRGKKISMRNIVECKISGKKYCVVEKSRKEKFPV